MRTKHVPGQNYQGVIGFRINLGPRDAIRCLFGQPLTLGIRLITPIRVPGIQTQATLLVGGKPARNTAVEFLDIPPGANDAAPVA
jgi:hypothetical protein